MTTKTLTGTYASGYEINVTGGGSGITILSIAASGYVEGGGVFTKGSTSAYTISNLGKVVVAAGRYAINLVDGGAVTNGSGPHATALLSGGSGVVIRGQVGSVTNYGSILAGAAFGKYGGDGVFLTTGHVSNGAAFDTSAIISGYRVGVEITGAGTVVNAGEILGAGYKADGVQLGGAGAVTNGAVMNTGALIEGGYGVDAIAIATITNYGSIVGLSAQAGGFGIQLNAAGVVTNGRANDVHALIQGLVGVEILGDGGTVANFGTILGGTQGVAMINNGRVANGSATDHAALIEGDTGVYFSSDASATVTNFGTVLATGGKGFYGVEANAGGTFTNGSVDDTSALIEGYGGALLSGSGVNFGTIAGDGAAGSAIQLYFDSFTNGAANDTTATLRGNVGAYLRMNATLTNFGTVTGVGGPAVFVYDFSAAVIAEAGSVFEGVANIGGGSLDVVSGVASLDGLLSSGAITGAGTLSLDGGVSEFSAGISVAIPEIDVSGAAQVEVLTNLSLAAIWAQSGGVTQVAAGDKLTFTGAGDSFSGAVNGPGTLVFSGGSDTFSNLNLSATSQTVTNAAITLSGAITLGANLTVTSPTILVAAGGATLSGAGEFFLSSNATNSLFGVSDTATLIDNGKIVGAGNLGAGQLTLIVGASGLIDGSSTVGLDIDTGAVTIHNAGTVESVGTGGVTVASAVNNTGKLYASGGTLTLQGAVTGAGIGEVNKGTLFAAGAFGENVTFVAGATGTLELAHAQTFGGTITGFSLTGANSLDLGDITFASKTTKATYSGTTAGGTLTVTDGTHTASIKLTGNYTASTFTVSSDGHGGTKVVDPSHTSKALIDAMGSFAPAAAASGAGTSDAGTLAHPILATPG